MSEKKIDDDSLKELFPDSSKGKEKHGDFSHIYKFIDSYLRNEQPGEKILSYPRAMGHFFEPVNDYKLYDFEKVPVDDLVKGIDINSLEMKEGWNNDPTKNNYEPAKDKDLIQIIRAKRKLDGSYDVDVGKRRLLALKNSGYTHAVLPIYDEFAHSHPFMSAMYQARESGAYPDAIRWMNRFIKDGTFDRKTAERFKKMLHSKQTKLAEIEKMRRR